MRGKIKCLVEPFIEDVTDTVAKIVIGLAGVLVILVILGVFTLIAIGIIRIFVTIGQMML